MPFPRPDFARAAEPDAASASAVGAAGAIYARLAQGDVEGALARLARDVAWDHDPGVGPVPVVRTLRGRAAVATALRSPLGPSLGGAVVLRLMGRGPEAVAVVETAPHGQGRIELHLWSLDEDGRVERFRRVAPRPADLAVH